MVDRIISCNKCGEIFGEANSEDDLYVAINEAVMSHACEYGEAFEKLLCPKCNGYYDRLEDE